LAIQGYWLIDVLADQQSSTLDARIGACPAGPALAGDNIGRFSRAVLTDLKVGPVAREVGKARKLKNVMSDE